MSAFDHWVKDTDAAMRNQMGGAWQEITGDIGSTYQAFLMADTSYRVPTAHDYSPEEGQAAAQAYDREREAEPEITAPEPSPEPEMG